MAEATEEPRLGSIIFSTIHISFMNPENVVSDINYIL